MKTVLGVCKWCGQIKTIEVAESANPSEEERDELASEECDCATAEMERNRREMINKATEEINEYTENAHEQEAGKILLTAIEGIVKHKVKSISVKVRPEVTYRMEMSKSNGLVVERNEKITDDVTA